MGQTLLAKLQGRWESVLRFDEFAARPVPYGSWLWQLLTFRRLLGTHSELGVRRTPDGRVVLYFRPSGWWPASGFEVEVDSGAGVSGISIATYVVGDGSRETRLVLLDRAGRALDLPGVPAGFATRNASKSATDNLWWRYEDIERLTEMAEITLDRVHIQPTNRTKYEPMHRTFPRRPGFDPRGWLYLLLASSLPVIFGTIFVLLQFNQVLAMIVAALFGIFWFPTCAFIWIRLTSGLMERDRKGDDPTQSWTMPLY